MTTNLPTRRDLLKTTTAAFVAGSVAPAIHARGTRAIDGAEVLKVGLIGCGGRGTGAAANALKADPQTKLVAMGDAFADSLDNSLNTLMGKPELAQQVAVDEDHKFVGFDAFRKVIEASDVVVLATPPHFRPEHLAACVDAGRHVFCEKPVAVDAPGVRSVLATAQKASEVGLSIVSGLCYRYQFAKRETLERVHDGAVGDIVTMQTTYNTGGLWDRKRQPDWTDMEWQVRNWLYFTWLSGDHITEQHIHSLDKIAWAMQDVYPAKCTSSGGRAVRTDPKYGNIFDHFNTVYEWENGAKAFSSCRQWNGATPDVSDHVYGTRGVAHLQSHKIQSGAWKWRYRGDGPDDMYQNEHDALFQAIRKGDPINNGEYMCKSTLMAIMARMSAYTGQSITWQQALESQEDLSPPAYEWGEIATPEVARPGVTKFV